VTTKNKPAAADGKTGLSKVIPLDEHPAYKPELAKLGTMRAELDQVRLEIRQETSPADADGNPRTRQATRSIRLAGLYDRQEVLERQAREQELAMAAIAARLSREQEARLLPAYRAVQRRILEALVDLARANDLEWEFFRDVDQLGYGTPRMLRNYVAFVGGASEYSAFACEMIREAVANGTIPHTDKLVGSVAALNGREHFLPGQAERIEREKREAARECARRSAEVEAFNRHSRLWGGRAAASAAPAEDRPRAAKAGPTAEELLGQRVRDDVRRELDQAFDLVDAAAGRE
jgi:hypothetical protein